jgi:hypothetical protein
MVFGRRYGGGSRLILAPGLEARRRGPVGDGRAPAWTRTAKVANRVARRRSLVQIRTITGPARVLGIGLQLAATGSDRTECHGDPELGGRCRAATTRHSPSMMRAKRPARVGAGAGVTNRTRTQPGARFQHVKLGQRDFRRSGEAI